MRGTFERKLKTDMKQYGRDQYSELKMKETAAMVKHSYKNRKSRQRISYGRFLVRQMQFTGGRIWAFQAAALAVICFLVNAIYESAEPRQIAFSLGIASVAAVMTGIPYLYRSFHYDMYETETAAKFSYSGLLFARIIITGSGNLVMLAAIFLVVYLKSSLSVGGAMTYMLVPFSAVWIGCLFIMEHSRGRKTHLYCAAFCIGFILLLFTLFKSSPQIFAREMFPAWTVVCIVMTGGLLIQIRSLVKRPSGMDMVSM